MNNGSQFTSRGVAALGAALFGCLLAFTAPKASAQNQVLNPGFETGNFTDWVLDYAPTGSDLGVGSGNYAHTGDHYAYFGATGGVDDYIGQVLTTTPGAKYKLTFWVAPHSVDGEFQAFWDGVPVYTTTGTANSSIYTKVVVNNLVASGNLMALTFGGQTPPGSYDIDDVSLVLASFKPLAHTANQLAVATNLDNAANDPRAANLISYLNNDSIFNFPHAFDLISPAALTSLYQISDAFADVQSSNIQNHLAQSRAAIAPPQNNTTVGLVVRGGNDSVGLRDGYSKDDGKDSKDKLTETPAPEIPRWNIWSEGNGDFVRVTGDANAAGYNFNTGGVTLGADYRVCDHFIVGLMGGYANTGATVAQGGSVDVNAGKFGIYSTAFSNGFYVDTLATGGYNSYDTHRNALGGPATGSTDGEEFDGFIGTGYDLHQGNVTLGPVLSAQYTYVNLNNFSEIGSQAPLSYPTQYQDSLHTQAGFRISADWKVGNATVTPSLMAAWQHEFLDSADSIDSQFANGAGGIFTVNGPKLGRDAAVVNAGVSVQWTPRFGTYLYYYGEQGRKDYELNSVTGGVKFSY